MSPKNCKGGAMAVSTSNHGDWSTTNPNPQREKYRWVDDEVGIPSPLQSIDKVKIYLFFC